MLLEIVLSKLSPHKLSKFEWFMVAVVMASVVLSFLALRVSAQSDGALRVYFLDVGQGDSEFIDFKGNQILIDGGPDGSILQQLGKVMPFYDRSIDVLILTHPHSDHVSGLIEVLKRYKVGQIIENYTPYNTAEYAEWNKAKQSTVVIQARAGQVVGLGDGAKLTILYPFDPVDDDETTLKNSHDAMVVSRLDYGDERVLFMGDAEEKTEYKLLSGGASLSAQFLKVGHHGSKTSTGEQFLKAVSPILAFVEAGAKNKYGHPHAQVLERLDNYGIKYYRTDIDGTVELILDGQDYNVEFGK